MVIKNNYKINGINAIVATDLDGTLLRTDQTVSKRNRDTLTMLGEKGILRVIVTGRSYYSLRQVVKEDLPIDYLIVSCGSGIYCCKNMQLIYNTNLSRTDTKFICNKLIKLGCNFMLHYPLPDNHKFLFYKKNKTNSDYNNIVDIDGEHGKPLDRFSELPESSTQFLIIDSTCGQKYEEISKIFTKYTIIRTTSHLHDKLTWIEIFPLKTDKGKTLKILTESYNLGSEDVLSIGNDFNDLHMLRWAEESKVVSNAHSDLKTEFKTVSSNDEDGFSEAVDEWLKKKNP